MLTDSSDFKISCPLAPSSTLSACSGSVKRNGRSKARKDLLNSETGELDGKVTSRVPICSASIMDLSFPNCPSPNSSTVMRPPLSFSTSSLNFFRPCPPELLSMLEPKPAFSVTFPVAFCPPLSPQPVNKTDMSSIVRPVRTPTIFFITAPPSNLHSLIHTWCAISAQLTKHHTHDRFYSLYTNFMLYVNLFLFNSDSSVTLNCNIKSDSRM